MAIKALSQHRPGPNVSGHVCMSVCLNLSTPFPSPYFQVSIVAFKRGGLDVRAHAWDRNLGGRDFDEALFQVRRCYQARCQGDLSVVPIYWLQCS